jgi:hypothetical protein
VQVQIGGDAIVRELPAGYHVLVYSHTAVGPEPVRGFYPARDGQVDALYPRQGHTPHHPTDGQATISLRTSGTFDAPGLELIDCPADAAVVSFDVLHSPTPELLPLRVPVDLRPFTGQ